MSFATVGTLLVKSFWEPFQRSPLLIGVLLGVLLLAVSVLLQAILPEDARRLGDVVGLALNGGGAAILGTGVFTAIVKSSQFAEIFQKHVMEALYDPDKVHTSEQLRQSWMSMTRAMLRRALDSDADRAARKIHEIFLNADLELSHTYHDVHISYDMTVDADGNAKVVNTMYATLKVPLGVDAPCFSQWLKTDGDKRLTYLRIGDHEVDLQAEQPAALRAEQGELTLSYPLAGLLGEGRTVEVERTFEICQHLPTEPFITAVIEKYLFGLEVRVRVNRDHGDYAITYIKSGKRQNKAAIAKDGAGFFRWVVSPPKTLLWPGSGYTLIFTK